MTDTKQAIDRRRFLGTAALAGVSAIAFPAAGAAIGTSALGASERLVVGVMGVNGRGNALAKGFAKLDSARVAWVCDVDERAVAKARTTVEEAAGKAPDGAGDFRKMLDESALDAIVIAAPNHWHAPAAILACAAGKHVYVEKPLSHNAREGEILVEAARKHRRVVQMGNQRRTWEKIAEAVERVRGGLIGNAFFSTSWYGNSRPAIGRGKTTAVPSWLDFDLWQGPAPRRDFVDNLVHYDWHWRWHWGNGELGNNGVHGIDLCRWGLGVEFPSRVTSAGGRYVFADDQETPDTHVVTYEFAGGKAIRWEGLSCNRHALGGDGFGVSFHGDAGTVVIGGSGYEVFDAADKSVEKVDGPRDDSDHFRNFVDCVRTGAKPASDVEGAHRSTLLCHLGNIAQRTGRALRCDAANGHIIGDPQAMELWGREYAPGWEPKA